MFKTINNQKCYMLNLQMIPRQNQLNQPVNSQRVQQQNTYQAPNTQMPYGGAPVQQQSYQSQPVYQQQYAQNSYQQPAQVQPQNSVPDQPQLAESSNDYTQELKMSLDVGEIATDIENMSDFDIAYDDLPF